MRWERSLDLILGSGEPWKVLDQAGRGTAPLKLQWAHESTGNLIKTHILIQQVWGGVRDSACVRSSQVTLMLLVQGPV